MRKLCSLLGSLLVLITLVRDARAATWAQQRTTPHLRQIFAVDKTGEPAWPYGFKDVFGDGPTFNPPEQQRNLRTAYAAADATRFWARVYVSNATAIDPAVTVFVFVDTDQNTATGGGTASVTLSPLFTTEHSPGGYEYAVAMLGNGTSTAVWSWQQSTTSWTKVTTQPTDTAAEIGQDIDPIGIAFNGSNLHGYVQGNVLLSIVGLTSTCNANLYVRSAGPTAMPPSDLDMAFTTSCVPAATNGIPTIIVPPGCTSDAQCPENGVCANGQCVLAAPCLAATDCPNGDLCDPDGYCVPPTGPSCAGGSVCANGLVCVGNQCVACTQGQNQCAAGMTCAPNGTCVTGTGGGLPGGDHVEGGALQCAVRAPGAPAALSTAALVAVLAWAARRRRR